MPVVPRVLLFPALGAAGAVKGGAVAGTGVRGRSSATSKKGNRKWESPKRSAKEIKMKAIWNGAVLAESEKTVRVEG